MQKNTKWKRTSDKQKSFEALQKLLSCNSVLSYEIGYETKLQVDARPNWIGLILLQKRVQGVWQFVNVKAEVSPKLKRDIHW